MTENETEDLTIRETPTRRRSSALVGRFLAVGLFVALGTFAVIQSLSIAGVNKKSDKTNPEDTSINEVVDNKTPDNPIVETPVVKNEKPEIRNPLTVSKSTFGSVANTKPSMPKVSSGTFSKTLKPVTPVVVTPKQTGTFGASTPLKSNPVVAPIVTPASPPKNRIAQLDNGSPTSSFGIGGPAIPPAKTTTQAIGDATNSLKQKVGDAASSARTRFNQLGSSLKDSASEATSRAKSAFDNTASRFSPSTSTPDPVSSGSPFPKSTPQIKPIEAKSTLGNGGQQRPFSSNQPNSGFRSQSLNPISSSSTQQTRTPSNTPVSRPGSSFPPAKSNTASNPSTRNPFERGGMSRAPSSGNALSSRQSPSSPSTRLPTTSSRAPVMQASRVSPKPGDRQYEGVQSPSLIIQKFSPKEIQVNQTADFEVKIRNVGRVSVDDVLVVDQVPEGARFIDANPKPSSRSRTDELRWQLGTMNPGEERTILLQLQPTVAGEIGSVAQFYFGGRATNRTKVTQPQLKITHTADPKVLIGNDVIFDVIVENTGNGPAKDVFIQEEVPELLEYQDGSRELEYEVGTLQPGQSRRLKLGLKAARIGRLKNIMFASAKGGLQARHETDIEIIAPKLTTTSEGPTRRFIKRKATHTFTVANQGTAAATNLRLIARLPSGLRFVDANNRGRYDRNSHSVIWQMRDLAAGGSGDVEIVTTPIEAGEQNIKFEAAADLNQRSETVQALNVDHLIDVFFDIDDVVDPIEIGAETQYRIRLVNQGTQAASNVQLQIDFPNGLEPTAVNGDLRNQIRGQQIVFEPITSLRSGEELKVSVQATGRAQGDHRIVVNMQADGRDTPVSKQETTRVYSDR